MPKLTLEEELMNDRELIFYWLKSGRITCEDLIQQYANILKIERDQAKFEAVSYTYPLFLMQEKSNLKSKDEWIRDKAIQMLYAFNNKQTGINFNKQFEKYVKEHRLNKDLNTIQYIIYEDELNKFNEKKE